MKKNRKGFTLIELLVVIAIVAILAVVVVVVLNPAELLKQARDSNRVSDLATLKSAVSLYLVDATSANLASSTGGYGVCYLSTISGNGTTTAKCGVFSQAYYTANSSVTAATYRNRDSTGWVPVNFAQISYGSPLSNLPVDPTNNTSYYYSYSATTTGGNYFEFAAWIESAKYRTGSSAVVTTSTIYETGNQPGLTL